MVSKKAARKNATASALTVEDQIEAEITEIQGRLMAESRIVVESAASESVMPDMPVNEGPVSASEVPPAETPAGWDAIESGFETGAYVIPAGRALAHEWRTITGSDVMPVCGRAFPLEGATVAGPLTDRCAYCEDGTEAPADTDDEPAALKPRASRTQAATVTVTDAEHIGHFGALLAGLTAYVESHGNGADARAFYGLLTGAAETIKPLTKRDRATRPATDGSTVRTYVRVMPTGRVSVTLNLNGESVSVASMGDACRKLAACMPSAEKCAAYVKRIDVDKLTANARVYLQADIDAGRVPAEAVTFGTK
jgi:hypothetical protein